jgi:hypothetical protein
MSKISELSDGGVIQGGDTLIAVRSGGNVKVTYGGTTTANIDGGTIDGTVIGGTTPAAGSFTTGSFTGDVSFGDNDKAIFGAGSDLKIYHDGSDSYIDDTGTGRLRLRGAADIILAHPTNGETYATFSANGANTFYYDNAAKLATTSTGIDVTGTVTADSVGIGAAGLYFNDGGTKDLIPYSLTASDTVDNSISLGISSKRFKDLYLSGTAYVATSVGIGTSSPDYLLHLEKAGGVMAQLKATDSNQAYMKFVNSTTGDGAFTDGLLLGVDSDESVVLWNYEATATRFATGGTERMRIDSSGNVGIGTSSPSSVLHLSTSNDPQITLTDTGFGASADITGSNGNLRLNSQTATIFDMADSEVMRIDSSGNLLVGTTTTDGGYDESDGGASTTFMGASIGGAANGSAFVSRRAAPLQLNRQANDGDIAVFRKNGTTVGSIGTFNSVPYFAGQNANAGGFRIDSTGSNGVIIPTTNTGANRDAATDLGYSSGGTNIRFRDLYLSNSVVVTTATNGTSLLDLGDTADSDIGRIAYDNSVDAMYFQTNNSERMRIDSSGNLLVGDTSVIRASSQNGVSVEPEGRIYMSRGTGTGGFSHLQFYNGNGAVGSVVTSGSSTSYNTSSDYRLKENVVPLTGATERVKQLNPSRFNFIVDADTTVDGFLAHEVADVVPEAITGTKDAMRDEEYEVTPAVYEDVVIPAVLDEEGNEVEAERTEQQLVTEAVMGTRSVPDYQGIDQSKLVPLLVATIQELEARIAALESN